MRTLLKLLQHNIWYKVIVSLKKWHYEKKFTYYCFFPPYTTFFFLRFTFLKTNSYRVKTNKKMKKKKTFTKIPFFFLFSKKKQSSFNKNSRNIILKKSKERQRRISKKNKMNKMVKKRIKKDKNGRTRLFIDRWKQNKDYLKKECVSILQIL